jgi:hypothetical protein
MLQREQATASLAVWARNTLSTLSLTALLHERRRIEAALIFVRRRCGFGVGVIRSWRTHVRIIDDVMQQNEESSATNARPRDQR